MPMSAEGAKERVTPHKRACHENPNWFLYLAHIITSGDVTGLALVENADSRTPYTRKINDGSHGKPCADHVRLLGIEILLAEL